MPIDELKELGLKVKAARKGKGLTQQGLADICHVSTKQIANIERGKMNHLFSFEGNRESPSAFFGLSTVPDITEEDEKLLR